MKKLLFIIDALLIIFAFKFQVVVNAMNDDNKGMNGIVVADELTMFGELQNERWFVFQPILDDAEDDYEFKSTLAIQKYYRQGSVIDYPINEEKYGLFGVDSTNVVQRLTPSIYLDDQITLGATGYVSISISTVAPFPDPEYISRNNDTLKMKNMYSDLAISGDSTRVGYGKILYRVSYNQSTWGNWSYVDLETYIDTNVTLNFYGSKCVQIVVIYEVKEKAPSIFQSNKYYHVRGIYQFIIV